MDKRNETIVKEILYWKQNRLLPEQYCDFLLALYSEGMEKPERLPSKTTLPYLLYTYVSVILLLLPLSFLVIYFTELGIILQTGLLSTFVGIAFILYRSTSYQFQHFTQTSLVILLVLVMVFAVYITGYWMDNNLWVYLMAGIHSIIWLVIGRLKQYTYLKILGLLGIIVIGLTTVF
ncbi:hypothetical protein LF817_03195 [Halobacillus sp. A1]|uniref:hypothetical protein n=1 Tax=Halobacillus sp. A1 TaxID=2880262 RepID=UPI0020A67C23|nr:hypothetical protein [Halobacillus sp. A1]MCP3030339.1 hypothetical protein [Halobacillus sp. A1]